MDEPTRHLRRHWRMVAAVSIASLAVAGCSNASPSASAAPSSSVGGGAGGATTVDVTLQEWAVVPSISSAPAGEITFAVTNNGPNDVHEFVVLKTDLDPADLPTDEHGAVTEAGEGMEVIDEIEGIPVGDSPELPVTLVAGNYVLLCNIYDATEDEAHYKMGMRIAFVVTE